MHQNVGDNPKRSYHARLIERLFAECTFLNEDDPLHGDLLVTTATVIAPELTDVPGVPKSMNQSGHLGFHVMRNINTKAPLRQLVREFREVAEKLNRAADHAEKQLFDVTDAVGKSSIWSGRIVGGDFLAAARPCSGVLFGMITDAKFRDGSVILRSAGRTP